MPVVWPTAAAVEQEDPVAPSPGIGIVPIAPISSSPVTLCAAAAARPSQKREVALLAASVPAALPAWRLECTAIP